MRDPVDLFITNRNGKCKELRVDKCDNENLDIIDDVLTLEITISKI